METTPPFSFVNRVHPWNICGVVLMSRLSFEMWFPPAEGWVASVLVPDSASGMALSYNTVDTKTKTLLHQGSILLTVLFKPHQDPINRALRDFWWSMGLFLTQNQISD